MAEAAHLAITISRQLGSGASTIGRRLATQLDMVYLDREILQRASKELNVPEDVLEERDETVTPFWQALMSSSAYGMPELMYTPLQPTYPPTDHEVFLAQSRIIEDVARKRSAIIVGRGGVHVLRDHPRHLSVFLHADPAWRARRIQESHNMTEPDARAAVEDCDRARMRYHRMVVDREWYDATQYHLCLDTSALGLDACAAVIVSAAEALGTG